jgi:hypothetical protein
MTRRYGFFFGQTVKLICFSLFCFFLLSCDKKKQGQTKEPLSDSAKVEASDKVPVIYAPQPDFDFGTVKQGERVEHVFTIKNTGTADLEIIRAKGS